LKEGVFFIRRAVLSVSKKEGLIPLASALVRKGVEIVATGGTAKLLEEHGIAFLPMESITGNPEAFGGRMKSISFPFASSLLFRRGHAEDEQQAKNLGVQPIDLVVCNLYPFAEARAREADDVELVEQIDVGGPTMVRAAAKNHASVVILTDPSQYPSFLEEWQVSGGTSLASRRRWAVDAFRLLSRYDTMVACELAQRFLQETDEVIVLEKGRPLRYGENPHQSAKFYRDPLSTGASLAGASVLQGKALSYNNLLDADAALRAASDAFLATDLKDSKELMAVAVVKHLNPCGLAVAGSALEALELAWAGDPVSAFGGILCFTGEVTGAVAHWLKDKFVELVIAPSFESEAIEVFAKKKNLRLLLCPRRVVGRERMIRSIWGGWLVQDEDEWAPESFESATKEPWPTELTVLGRFGVAAAKHLRSNAIALVREAGAGNFQLVGAGMGQPNRIDSFGSLAVPRAKEKGFLLNTILVSDAFFPFPDMVEAAEAEGIKYIIQPGGSLNDAAVVAAADQAGIAMAFTGRRHFRH
jgi:phosphoribosylaminoimidazolecarboxamide formyltransferase / IMP cyclohydrolase